MLGGIAGEAWQCCGPPFPAVNFTSSPWGVSGLLIFAIWLSSSGQRGEAWLLRSLLSIQGKTSFCFFSPPLVAVAKPRVATHRYLNEHGWRNVTTSVANVQVFLFILIYVFLFIFCLNFWLWFLLCFSILWKRQPLLYSNGVLPAVECFFFQIITHMWSDTITGKSSKYSANVCGCLLNVL